jgi:hypothetical protein
MQNLGTFFNNHYTNFKTGIAYKLGRNGMYIDTINSIMWKNTPHNIDIAVIYPFDSVSKNTIKERIMEYLFNSINVKKIFLVSWTVSYDFTGLIVT